jgi:hypothetical protein
VDSANSFFSENISGTEVVISYRGTEDVSLFTDPHTGWAVGAGTQAQDAALVGRVLMAKLGSLRVLAEVATKLSPLAICDLTR